jgi:hypothetical protein
VLTPGKRPGGSPPERAVRNKNEQPPDSILMATFAGDVGTIFDATDITTSEARAETSH